MTVPVHLVLGTLGSGKTTTVLSLLETAPADERWAVFINEFGRVGIDPVLIEGAAGRRPGRLEVRESAGGCICCSAEADLGEGIRQLVRDFGPHRILIEPTGLADPLALKTRLLREGERWGVRLESTIGVVDVRRFGNKRVGELPFWRALLDCCDDVLGSKADRADPAAVEGFRSIVGEWFPPKRAVFVDRETLAQSEWASPVSLAAPQFFHLPPKSGHLGGARQVLEETPLAGVPGRRFLEGMAEGMAEGLAVGWIFDTGLSFRRDALKGAIEALASSPGRLLRLKGLVHTDAGWFALQIAGADGLAMEESAYRRDSRIEIIVDGPEAEWKSFEHALLRCIL